MVMRRSKSARIGRRERGTSSQWHFCKKLCDRIEGKRCHFSQERQKIAQYVRSAIEAFAAWLKPAEFGSDKEWKLFNLPKLQLLEN
ncbi:hypothetical protein H6P81_006307 [Aristolochia fimbriata]|uniref:Uncharacterized protein n=1 Tax=Aristolochia fimbriata TaxID=158543 RepID=A0AAV7EXE6_ARIFI|nr:hypothetical protein H6P81_006307 [Aristolochia fimbriata]